jgi:CRISPR-associated endoribonuclease Cas6
MRVRLRLTHQKETGFFIAHRDLQRGITALVYDALRAADPDLADHLHREGWRTPRGTRVKLFSYSRLLAPGRLVTDRGVWFCGPRTHLYFASPFPEVVSAFAAGALARGDFDLAGVRLGVLGADHLKPPETPEGELAVRTLSPVVISDSRSAPQAGRRFLRLSETPELALARLAHAARIKWEAGGRDPAAFRLGLLLGRVKDKYVYHDGAGYAFAASEAELILRGPAEVLGFVYDAGLGEKTGMGFGCLGPAKGGIAA